MRLALRLHPDSRCTAATAIALQVVRPSPGSLELRYLVSVETGDLRLPPVAEPARRDELWRHTCFEAFVRSPPVTSYYEFNFAPSTEWAAYCFSGYRSGMSVAREVSPPRIEVRSDGACFELRAALALDRLQGLPSDGAWRLGLAAVIEETSGRKSYWALAHPPGKADFHHADCFALELPAAWRP